MAVVGESVLHIWSLGITGLAGDMSANMDRYPDAITQITATETVSISEVGVSGSYRITYTPLYANLYVLDITESVYSSTTHYEDPILSAASAAVVDDGYCSVADVEGITQLGTPSTSTTPTEAEVLGFIAKRASQVYGRLAKYLGTSAPGPANWTLTIDTDSDQGKALSQACRLANAVGAAIDCLTAASANQSPASSQRVEDLSNLYAAALDELEAVAIAYGGSTARTETAYSAGEVYRGAVVSKQDQGLVFDSDTEW